MGHLTPEDVVDMLEGRAPDLPVRHAESCAACQTLVDDARRTISLAATDEIPEPSPLFWTQFSARVAAAVRRAPAPERRWPALSWSWSAAPVGAVIVLLGLAGLTGWQSWRQQQSPAAGAKAVPLVKESEPWPAFPVDDEPFTLISQVMAAVTEDEIAAADLPAPVGSADRALESLSEAEQAELTRLLKAELDGPESSS